MYYVHDFLIEYYVTFNPATDPDAKIIGIDLNKLDILRWKIFGNPVEDSTKTEAISDFFPFLNTSAANPATTPTCIGTDYGIDQTGVTCQQPVVSLKDQALSTAARECYTSDAGSQFVGQNGVHDNCNIQTFVLNHSRNYVTLTNIVNPDIIGLANLEDRKDKANIYYRIIAKTTSTFQNPINTLANMPLENAQISADGYANQGKVQQSIDVQYGLSSFLPVFNFSLYNADTTKPIVHAPVDKFSLIQ